MTVARPGNLYRGIMQRDSTSRRPRISPRDKTERVRGRNFGGRAGGGVVVRGRERGGIRDGRDGDPRAAPP